MTYRSILISGASSGIGRALAQCYASPGTHLALLGRDEPRLNAIAALCRKAGATVVTLAEDVRAREALADWIKSVDQQHPIDLVVASAGVTSGTGFGRRREHPDLVRATLDINIAGTLNTAEPVIERMCLRGKGRVALVGSLAALRGLPYSPAYCASKAAVHAYAEALRANLASQGVRVTLIVPGFVATQLNQEMICAKPLQMTVERAARIIQRGLDRGADVIAFPRLLYYGMPLLRLVPRRWADAILNSFHVDIPERREHIENQTRAPSASERV